MPLPSFAAASNVLRVGSRFRLLRLCYSQARRLPLRYALTSGMPEPKSKQIHSFDQSLLAANGAAAAALPKALRP